ncbi:MAG TPA: peptidyl-tRNA hydrolase Pth2 [Candidatus Nanoarchaeia archaeon]|nr:peptidyl-tRNA hydrolase Pth2 [Candidatus Nanoarchaeia archaeon]
MKQVILVREDLKLPKGKMAAQVAHAAVEATLNSSKSKVDEWHSEGMMKIVLKVANLKELQRYQQLAKAQKLTTAVITDAGHTVVEPGTITCLAIGPDDVEKIDKVTGPLKMM